MIAALAPLAIVIKSLSLDAITANILSFALLAFLSTIMGMALLKISWIIIKKSTPKWVNFTSFLLFFLSFLMIILSLALSFYLVLLPRIKCIVNIITQCTPSSIAQIVNVANILPIVLHGFISMGIGIAFLWTSYIYYYRTNSKYAFTRLNWMACLIFFPALVIIVIYLGLILWSGLLLF